MTDTRGMNRRIKDALVTMLTGLQYDAGEGAENAFVSVLDNTHDDADGSPIARVLPDGFQSVTVVSGAKDRTDSFAVIVTWPLEDPTDIESDLYNQMYDITDLIAQLIDHGDFIGTLSTIDPTIQDWRMDLKKASWKVGIGKGGASLLCEILISVTYSIDIW